MSDYDALFRPASIAVVGASAKGVTSGNRLIRILQASGFDGQIYPIHPKVHELEGYKCYQTFRELPETADYAFVCVGAEKVPGLVEDARNSVRFMQVMSGGFGEAGADGTLLQQKLEKALHGAKLRLLGPNCIGMFSGPGRVSFIEGCDFGPGELAVISQSGGLSIDILRRGQQMGLRFHSVLSIGNSMDLGATELLARHLADPTIKVIGLYLEHTAQGRELFDLLRKNSGKKPIVILKGGMTGEGQKAAASHTGSIADDERTWHALANQTGAILQYDLTGFLNLLSIFQSYPPKFVPENTQLLLIGNGGGASVLAADQFARNGIPMLEIEKTIRQKLEDLRLPAGSSVANPIDLPANALSKNNGASIASILDLLSADPKIGIVIMHLNLTVIAGYESEEIIGNALSALLALREKLGDQVQIGLVARSDYSPEAHASAMECRRQGAKANIPVFDELPQAAETLGHYRKFSRFQKRRGNQSL